MGYSLSWLAFRGVSPEAAMQRLHLTDTGQTVEYASAPVAGQALPDGWHLVVATRCDHPLVSPEALRLLSETEGIIPAIESAHAVAGAVDLAREIGPGGIVLINVSGRGDKDMATAMEYFKLGEGDAQADDPKATGVGEKQ